MIKKLTLAEFEKVSPFVIHNIQEGFSRYPNGMLNGSPDQLRSQIMNMVEVNGIGYCYTDCYFGRLKEEEKRIIRKVLTEGEYQYMEGLQLDEEEIYQSYDPVLFDILLKLTSTEMLFSTFYFTKYPAIVWGNYNGQYPIFCISYEDLTEKYHIYK